MDVTDVYTGGTGKTLFSIIYSKSGIFLIDGSVYVCVISRFNCLSDVYDIERK